MTSPTRRQLTLATLDRQHLLRRSAARWPELLRSLLAVQGQEPASPYLALWARGDHVDPGELDAAFDDGTLVKCSAMRLTLHVMHHDDHAALRGAMAPTLWAGAVNDKRYTSTGLTPADAEAFGDRLAGAASEPIGKAEIDAVLTSFVGNEPPPGLWRALRYVAPLRHAPDPSSPWRFARTPRFVAAPTSFAHDAGVDALVEGYLRALGPARRADIAQFTLLRQPVILAALDRLGERIVRLDGPDGELVDLAGATVPADDVVVPPRLLPMWDNVMLAYADRSRIIPDEYRPIVIRRNGDTLPAVLVDGRVIGVWRPVGERIEVSTFEQLPAVAWSGIEAEAESLRAFVGDRDPALYGRYARWWSELPTAETRRL